MGISVLVFLEWVFCSLVSASVLILRQLWLVIKKRPTQVVVKKPSRKGEKIWDRVEGAQRQCGSSSYGWSIYVSVGCDGLWLSRRSPPK